MASGGERAEGCGLRRERYASRRGILKLGAGLAGLGLLPAALSHGIGSETQRPFAVVIVGGIVSATVFTLLLLPLVFGWIAGDRRAPAAPQSGAGAIPASTGTPTAVNGIQGISPDAVLRP